MSDALCSDLTKVFRSSFVNPTSPLTIVTKQQVGTSEVVGVSSVGSFTKTSRLTVPITGRHRQKSFGHPTITPSFQLVTSSARGQVKV